MSFIVCNMELDCKASYHHNGSSQKLSLGKRQISFCGAFMINMYPDEGLLKKTLAHRKIFADFAINVFTQISF